MGNPSGEKTVGPADALAGALAVECVRTPSRRLTVRSRYFAPESGGNSSALVLALALDGGAAEGGSGAEALGPVPVPLPAVTIPAPPLLLLLAQTPLFAPQSAILSVNMLAPLNDGVPAPTSDLALDRVPVTNPFPLLGFALMLMLPKRKRVGLGARDRLMVWY